MKLIVILIMLLLVLVSGCKVTMSDDDAYAIAESSECAEKGELTEEANYNLNTRTLWIEMDMKPEFEKEGCAPACVVDFITKTAEINWRCTGLIED